MSRNSWLVYCLYQTGAKPGAISQTFPWQVYTIPSTAMECNDASLLSSNTTIDLSLNVFIRWSPIQLLKSLSLLNFSSPTTTLNTLLHAIVPKELAQT